MNYYITFGLLVCLWLFIIYMAAREMKRNRENNERARHIMYEGITHREAVRETVPQSAIPAQTPRLDCIVTGLVLSKMPPPELSRRKLRFRRGQNFGH